MAQGTISTIDSASAHACESNGGLLRAQATAIAVSILDQSRRARDGSLAWLRPNRATAIGGPPLVAAGPHLYDGLSGIAVLYAALSRFEPNKGFREVSLEIVAPLRSMLDRLASDPAKARTKQLGLGGLVGIGSLVYALLTLAGLLEIPEMIAEAHRVAGLIAPEHIAADRSYDIVSGAAGAILALLQLERRLPIASSSGPDPIVIAQLCADHLLRHRVEQGSGSVAWSTDSRFPPLTGFAHGTAGICCALLQLYRRSGREELLDTAIRGLLFERSTFSQQHQNWTDPTSSSARFLNQWCFGAPGIAVARIATLDVVAGDVVRDEIKTALRVTSQSELGPTEHICCGDFGRVEVLTYASQKLGRPELRQRAATLAARSLSKAAEKGRFDGLMRTHHRDPSLFSGEAGIAYTLLRLISPEDLPCLLAMEC
jgi:type 2 lantibiotic biosynthesis protein LanM